MTEREADRAHRRADDGARHAGQHRKAEHVRESVERGMEPRDAPEREGASDGLERIARGDPERAQDRHPMRDLRRQSAQRNPWPEVIAIEHQRGEGGAGGGPDERGEAIHGRERRAHPPEREIDRGERQDTRGVHEMSVGRCASSHDGRSRMKPATLDVNPTSESDRARAPLARSLGSERAKHPRSADVDGRVLGGRS